MRGRFWEGHHCGRRLRRPVSFCFETEVSSCAAAASIALGAARTRGDGEVEISVLTESETRGKLRTMCGPRTPSRPMTG